MRRLLLLYSKPAIPGRVKTRLAPVLGADGAAELHAAFVHDVVSGLVVGDFDLRLMWALDDAATGEPPLNLLPPNARHLDWWRQQGRDLGERLFLGLEAAAAEAPYVAAVGSDHPEIDTTQVEDAFRRLEAGADVALGPVPDGGYYLIALRRHAVQRGLFDDIPWSTREVFERTRQRCRQLGLHLAVLPAGHDIDVAEDLEALIHRLDLRPGRCPATRSVLQGWGRLPPSSIF